MDGWDTILSALGTLPSLGGLGALGALVIIAIRMVTKGDSRYHDEVQDHERTQETLDAERERRRKAEDEVGEVRSEVRELRQQNGRLEAEVAALRARPS